MTPQIFPGLSRNDQMLIAPIPIVKCNKRDCYFCYQMIPKAAPIMNVTGYGNKFSKAEITYLLNTYKYRNGKVITEIAHNLKRSRKAIMQKHHQLSYL